VAIFCTGKRCKELLVEILFLLLGITLPLFFKETEVLSTTEIPKRTPIMLNFIPFYFFNSVLDFSNEMSFFGGVFSMYEIMKHAPCTCKRFSPENT
jgi:hypothetical protein